MMTVSSYPYILMCITFLGHVRVGAYPDGAPETACDSMRPMHYTVKNDQSSELIQPKSWTGLYTLTVNSRGVQPGSDFGVTIASVGANSFKGFLLEARRDGNGTKRFGTFLNKNYTKLICGNSAITHAQGAITFTALTAFWVAPKEPLNNIRFHATLVRQYDEIYLDVTSEFIVGSGVTLVPSVAVLVGVTLINAVTCMFH
ncbi:unnamed protein product [Lymnaea stagnalis]|uniref:Reelin domain-containing protein n=1 Tax=Lymnaea stagnalis TaxID=6523 RepID=A0AAV2IC35_LYMST